ncbi:MAG: DNA methyltransferase [Chloroflexi bacterium]|nr:DNA methyltransferase [Chloroflexota bacterium]
MSLQLIQQYHAQVDKIIRYGGSRNEATLRKPFQDLLEAYAQSKNLLLVPEVELHTRGKRVIPDGTLKDALRQDWGYWESKDEKDDLATEIAAKFAKGYPSTNILFEDSRAAVLYQNGAEIARADFADAAALDAILTRFVSYEPVEVTEFHRAIEKFNEDVPALADELRRIIEEQFAANAAFQTALNEFLELCKQAINPRVEMADAREMIIQHILTEDIFMTVFDEPQFHRENAIARKLQEVIATFYHGATRRNIHDRIAAFYETINARAAQIYNHHEKQKFLKALYENFYRAYNPKAADRLGIVYTPDEIVRFMIHAADHLTFKHFGKTLGDPNVEILDPATGTGTFITELIEYLPPQQLPHKYRDEIHCNEVAILPYYIANLNIEYTYKQKMGEYAPFENICFVDTLDNLGFEKSGQHQKDFFALVDENAERIQRQNERKISVIIGNPPYNANQLNENENNKNREYPGVDQRIKETYIKHSTAQKTKVYDMYARFLRWASDRVDKNGVIAFVSNNSFLDARTYDGFRKVVADEFNHVYVVDLKGDARTSGEQRRREGGNVFSDQIRVGVAVYFLVRKAGEKGCRIHYNAVPDYAHAEEKKAYLRDNEFADLKFEAIHPDKKHNWINQAAASDWETFIPVASKEAKAASSVIASREAAKQSPSDSEIASAQTTRLAMTSSQQTIFKLFSLGVATNRDEWVYDFDQSTLKKKVRFFCDVFAAEKERWKKSKKKIAVNDFVDRSIKWTSELEDHLTRDSDLVYDGKHLTFAAYRPFVKQSFYYDRVIVHRLYQQPEIFQIGKRSENAALCLASYERKVFSVIASKYIPNLNLYGDPTQTLPLYRYTADGQRVDNITDWAVEQFRAHYAVGAFNKTPLQKMDIFHYVYAVLHHPAYREKYALNLKREFPRIPFYDDPSGDLGAGFWQWASWGKQLLELHLNYEQVKPFALKRVDVGAKHPERSTAESKEAKPKDASPVQPKPRLLARKEQGVIEIDAQTTLHGVPPEAWEYRLGTYSALEWILERYKERAPKDPTIRAKFNTYKFADYKEQVIDLLQRVCTVSIETMKIVKQMPPR